MDKGISPPTQNNRLIRVELAIQRMEDKIGDLVIDLVEFKKHIDCVIDDHQATLYGDKGKSGLVGQSGTLEELRVALKGYGREPGLIADIQSLSDKMKSWDDGRKWLTRLVLGMIVTDIILHVFQIGP